MPFGHLLSAVGGQQWWRSPQVPTGDIVLTKEVSPIMNYFSFKERKINNFVLVGNFKSTTLCHVSSSVSLSDGWALGWLWLHHGQRCVTLEGGPVLCRAEPIGSLKLGIILIFWVSCQASIFI